MSKPKPARYRTTNWSTYNDALRKRGSLLIWLDKATKPCAPRVTTVGRFGSGGPDTTPEAAWRPRYDA